MILVKRNGLSLADRNAAVNTEVSNDIKSAQTRVLTSYVLRIMRRPLCCVEIFFKNIHGSKLRFKC